MVRLFFLNFTWIAEKKSMSVLQIHAKIARILLEDAWTIRTKTALKSCEKWRKHAKNKKWIAITVQNNYS